MLDGSQSGKEAAPDLSELKAQLAWCDAIRVAGITLTEDCHRIWTAYYRAGETPAAKKRMHEELDAAKAARKAAEIAAENKFQEDSLI